MKQMKMEQSGEYRAQEAVIPLSRGGYVVETPIGYVQFGSPPETIKDTMHLPLGVPQIFVLPYHFFSWTKGISVAEIEFPVYYNFFLNKKKTYIICSEEQYRRFRQLFQEAVFGPRELHLTHDFDFTSGSVHLPDLKKEIDYFRGSLKMSDFLAFGIFKNNRFTFRGVTIEMKKSGSFEVFAAGNRVANVPGKIEYRPTFEVANRSIEPYEPPRFGVTCLGYSHGFDPEGSTSGFIIWLNRTGIMVDPPVNSTEWLERSNVNPKFIDSIILTHCHADHDAGTFQKILEEGKVTVYTTRTIFESFLRKYAALTNVSEEYLKRLFDFHPMKIGKPTFIHGGRFDIFYTLHSIPTIGFQAAFQGRSLVYSSDHNNDPELHKKLFEDGVIDGARYKEFLNFPWDSDLIYHEAGIPPLHTPLTVLQSLPPAAQRRLVVYHISKKNFAPAAGELDLAEVGIGATRVIEVARSTFEKSYRILGILKQLDFFHDLSISKAQEFVSIVEEEHYRKGDFVIRKNSVGDKFYVIDSGNVRVIPEGFSSEGKIFGPRDYFGEAALILDVKRTADIIAETDVVVYTIEKAKFLHFIAGTDFERTLQRLATVRDDETWDVLTNSKSFSFLTATQKTWLESLLIPLDRGPNGTIIEEGKALERIYVIRQGEVVVSRSSLEIAKLGRGDFCGAMIKMHRNEVADFTFTHADPVSLYAIEKDDVLNFIEHNPGLIMKLVYDYLPQE